MRKSVVAANWKMNLEFDEARQLLNEFRTIQYDDKVVEVMVATPAPYLAQFSYSNTTQIRIVAQNCHEAESGAFTGEWSASMLRSIKVSHCIVGHSERRSIFGETDEQIADKVVSCLNQDIVPIVCCGESLEARESGKHFDVITEQLDAVFKKTSERDLERMIIAYEPVWAIGTGRTASAEQAQEMHSFIRKMIAVIGEGDASNEIRIIYGGSVKPDNAREIFGMPDVDGGLIGGASLKYDTFKAIIEATQ